MMRHTGGIALGDTSTRSRPFSSARRNASCVGITPAWPPSSAMTRTSGTRMRRLTRYESWAVGPCGGLEMFVLRLSVSYSLGPRGAPATGNRRFFRHPTDELFEGHDLELFSVPQTRGDAV